MVFRKMRRFKQQISEEECREVLNNAKRGVLSLLGEDGYPYGLPINHWYCEEDGKLYFHVYMTPPAAARVIEFVQEYDPEYISTLFA